MSMIESCDNCGLEIELEEAYIPARRRQEGFSDPFIFVHVECPKSYRMLAEESLAVSSNPLGFCILALIDKLDELHIVGLVPAPSPEDEG